MIIHDQFAQYSPEWWEARRGIPTASEFKDFIGVDGKLKAKGTVQTNINKYIGEIRDLQYGKKETYQSAAMKNGSEKESTARAWYEFDRDALVDEVGFCTTDDLLIGCSPDGLIGPKGGLEIKCPQGTAHVGYLRDGKLPTKYTQQVHGSMWVCEAEWWDFVSYNEDYPPFVTRVRRSDLTERVGASLKEFSKQVKAALKDLCGKCNYLDGFKQNYFPQGSTV